MQFPSNVKLIGFGHKARQGKDSAAQFIKELCPNVHILHWADGVYEEVSNVPKKEFLIYASSDSFWLRNKPGHYVCYKKEIFPKLQRMFTERGITQYDRMVKKDPEILQFWGTEYRRTHCGQDYWVDKTLAIADQIVEKYRKSGEACFIPVADTRFKNEAKAIRVCGGVYVDVIRYKDDGTRYLADDRDPSHPSEVDLDGVMPDYSLHAYDLHELREETKRLLKLLKVE